MRASRRRNPGHPCAANSCGPLHFGCIDVSRCWERYYPDDCFGCAGDASVLLEAIGVRQNIKQLFKELQDLQGATSHAVWPNRRKNKHLYQKLFRVRQDYESAMSGKTGHSFTMDDLRLLSCLVGKGGPSDQALGEHALGATEFFQGQWRWTFRHFSTPVVGVLHDTEASASSELVRVQSMLFPPDLPLEDWFNPTRRATHLRRIKRTLGQAAPQPPAKKLRSDSSASAPIDAAVFCPQPSGSGSGPAAPTTPSVVNRRSRSRSARRNALSQCPESSAHCTPQRASQMQVEEVRSTPRSLRAAEALALSTRKSEPASPWLTETSPLRAPSALHTRLSKCPDKLVEAEGVRPHIKQLFIDLRQLQGSKSHAVWPDQRNNNALY